MLQSRRTSIDASDSASAGDDWRALAEAARAGSVEARGKILESCRGYLLAAAARNLGDGLAGKAGASDMVQDTFTAAHQHFDRFAGTTEQELLAWLGTILTHNIASAQRRYVMSAKRDARREVPIARGNSSVIGGPVLVSDSSTPSAKLMAHEESQRLAAMLAELPEEYRRVIVLRNWERRRFDEIGVSLGKSPNAARKLWLRALARLEDLMSDCASRSAGA